MKSNSGPGEKIALSEIITCQPGDENGPNTDQELSDDSREMTASSIDKFSQKLNKIIVNPFCILIFALLMLTELICCTIQMANLFTKATSTLSGININPRYLMYSLTGFVLPPLLIGTALVWIKFLRKWVIFKVITSVYITEMQKNSTFAFLKCWIVWA